MGLALFICGYANVFITFDTFNDGPLLNKGSTLHDTLKDLATFLRPVSSEIADSDPRDHPGGS